MYTAALNSIMSWQRRLNVHTTSSQPYGRCIDVETNILCAHVTYFVLKGLRNFMCTQKMLFRRLYNREVKLLRPATLFSRSGKNTLAKMHLLKWLGCSLGRRLGNCNNLTSLMSITLWRQSFSIFSGWLWMKIWNLVQCSLISIKLTRYSLFFVNYKCRKKNKTDSWIFCAPSTVMKRWK